jgi:hypothetical protein
MGFVASNYHWGRATCCDPQGLKHGEENADTALANALIERSIYRKMAICKI